MARIQIRRDTSANWTCANPVLYEGELAFETDTKILKIGDGASQYNNVSTLSTPDLIDLTSISVCTNTASGNGNLSYDNTTGEFAFTPADIDSYFTNGNICNLYMTGTLCGPSTLTIDPAAHGDNTGTVVIAGNLQIDGTTTTINSTTLEVDDVNITLASGSVNAAASDGAGITVDLGSDGTATILYDATNDDWKLNKALQVADSLNVTSAGAPTLTIKTIAGSSYDATLTIAGARTASSTSEIAAIRLRNETSSAYDLARIIAFDPSGNHASGNGMLSFKVSNNGTLEQRLVISNDGNVGIGTSNPTEKLHVSGNIASEDVSVKGNVAIFNENLRDANFNPTSISGPLQTVNQYQSSLTVLSAENAYSILELYSAYGNIEYGKISFGTALGYQNGVYGWFPKEYASITGFSPSGTVVDGGIEFKTTPYLGNLTTRMIITEDGIVSIGSSYLSNAKLQVGGNISLSGGFDFSSGHNNVQWNIARDASNNLIFSHQGVAKMKLDTSGNLTVVGNITAYGTI